MSFHALWGNAMSQRSAFSALSGLGVFRGAAAEALGVTRKQLAALRASGAVVRDYPDTYRMAALPASHEYLLRGALLWAGRARLPPGARRAPSTRWKACARTRPKSSFLASDGSGHLASSFITPNRVRT